MKRFIAPLLIIATLFAMAVSAAVSTPSAEAAASCATHKVDATSWSTQTNDLSAGFDFQCGGAVGAGYRIGFHLQVWAGTFWAPEGCGVNSSECLVYRPDSSSFYSAGTEHGNYPNSDWTWSVRDHLAGNNFRIRAIVHFNNGDPNVDYYSPGFNP
jgi:opacity protein-like surface antigen